MTSTFFLHHKFGLAALLALAWLALAPMAQAADALKITVYGGSGNIGSVSSRKR